MADKCEACGRSGTDSYIRIRTTNGGLWLCVQCLDDINRKNPELLALQALAEEWEREAAVAESRRGAISATEARTLRQCAAAIRNRKEGAP